MFIQLIPKNAVCFYRTQTLPFLYAAAWLAAGHMAGSHRHLRHFDPWGWWQLFKLCSNVAMEWNLVVGFGYFFLLSFSVDGSGNYEKLL